MKLSIGCYLGLLLAAVVLVSGCGGAERIGTVPAKGKILFNGQPLAGASIRFYPEKGPAASGFSNDAGEFVMETNGDNPGVLPGTHQVTIEKIGPPDPKDEYAPRERLIPEKYATIQTSGLTVTVPNEGKTDIVIDLQGNPD
jgi:hypothetical protein